MSTYAPGTVAVATVRGVPNVRVFKLHDGDWAHARPINDGAETVFDDISGDDLVTDVRPLIVLDLPHPKITAKVLRRVAEYIREQHGTTVEDDQIALSIADQIEAQTKPPKPPEPRGLGAVVEAAAYSDDLRPFVRCASKYSPWIDECGHGHSWSELDAVRVLSEGVTNG